jgi:intein/homing endonuclease
MNKKYTFNKDFFETIDSEEKAYWLGFIAADGGLNYRIQTRGSNPSYRIQLGLAEKDLDHLIKFKESISSSHKLYKHCHKKYLCFSYRIIITSEKMFNDLVDKGLTLRKSLTLKPPLNVPADLIRHWIRGYFDGDGYIGMKKSRNVLRFSVLGTKEVLEFILKHVNLDLKIRKRKNIYNISSSCSKALKFLSHIYDDSNIFLDRKKEKFINYLEIKKVA